jgi:hypothetical protein
MNSYLPPKIKQLLPLNSLFGISVNATMGEPDWIRQWEIFVALNSLFGNPVNATDAVSAVFRGIGGENQRVIPLTPHLQQPL